MSSLNGQDATDVNDNATVVLKGQDNVHGADVFLEDGIRKLATSATATVESLFGEVVFPYTWMEIKDIGDNGDTVRVQIPDDSVDVTYTKVSGDTNDNDVAKGIRDALNADNAFKALYKASTPRDSNLTCMQALLIQTVRPDSGDVLVTNTGTIDVTLAYDTITDRAIALALFPHPSDCRKGTINVTGNVGVTATGRPPKSLGIVTAAQSDEMAVDGSTTPVIFKLSNNTGLDTTKDFLVTELRIEYTAGTLKPAGNNYTGIAALTNGHLIQIRSDGNLEYEENLKLVEDIHQHFMFGEGSKFDVITGPGGVSVVAVFARPFYVRKAGTSPIDDDIIVTVRDDMDAPGLERYHMHAVGFSEE